MTWWGLILYQLIWVWPFQIIAGLCLLFISYITCNNFSFWWGLSILLIGVIGLTARIYFGKFDWR